MKIINKLLFLISLAFFSFSCQENENENSKKEKILLAEQYLFQQNSFYRFNVETIDGYVFFGDTTEKSESSELIITIDNFKIQNDKNSLYTINNLMEETIYYPINSIIELELTFSYKDKLQQTEWVKFIDFSKSEWDILEYKNERNENIDIDYHISIKGRKVKNIVFNYNGFDYNGFEIEITTNSLVKEYNGNNVVLDYSDYQNQTMWFVEDLGMVKKTFVRENVDLQSEFMKYLYEDYELISIETIEE